MPKSVADSRALIFQAAAAEFAAHGLAGTTVDRIAARARLNKAMIYYHFKGKDALYDEVLRDIFSGLGTSLHAIAGSDAAPPDKLDQAIDAIAATAVSHPHFPAMMAREMAEAGVHLDRQTIASMLRVVTAVVGILRQGSAAGAFRDVNPVHTYFSIIAPLVFFLASRPVRERLRSEFLRRGAPVDLTALAGPDDFSAMLAEHKRAIGMLVAAPAPAARRRAAAAPAASGAVSRSAPRSRSNQRGPR